MEQTLKSLNIYKYHAYYRNSGKGKKFHQCKDKDKIGNRRKKNRKCINQGVFKDPFLLSIERNHIWKNKVLSFFVQEIKFSWLLCQKNDIHGFSRV